MLNYKLAHTFNCTEAMRSGGALFALVGLYAAAVTWWAFVLKPQCHRGAADSIACIKCAALNSKLREQLAQSEATVAELRTGLSAAKRAAAPPAAAACPSCPPRNPPSPPCPAPPTAAAAAPAKVAPKIDFVLPTSPRALCTPTFKSRKVAACDPAARLAFSAC